MRNGHVLACQRKRTARYPLKWEFPGGKLEDCEGPAAALARELREELAIEATVGREFHVQEWTYAEARQTVGPDDRYKVHYFIIPQFEGEPVNLAFEKIEWVTPEELNELEVLEGNREAVTLLNGIAGKVDA